MENSNERLYTVKIVDQDDTVLKDMGKMRTDNVSRMLQMFNEDCDSQGVPCEAVATEI